MKLFMAILLTVTMLFAFSLDGNYTKENVLADGNVTEEEADFMQEEWCNYNKENNPNLPTLEEQCRKYWEESSE